MHDLFTTVLSKRDLSRAGELFSIADYEIVNDLTEVLQEISSIISHEDYLHNSNDQSVIEICINRVTSCIKKTHTIEKHCAGLVNLLETCLRYNLQPSGKEVDPPHAKISSDIISSIFLNYNKQVVMEVTLPVAVKFLNQGNLELSRNLASYLSSAAIEYSYLLSPHVHVILESLLGGNYGLCHVLSQIYEATPDPINDAGPKFVEIVPRCELQEQLVILQLLVTIAKLKPSCLTESIPALLELATTRPQLSAAALLVLLKLAEAKPIKLAEYTEAFKLIAHTVPQTVGFAAQILSAIGRCGKDRAQVALDFVLEHLPRADRPLQTILLNEATKLCTKYPVLFTDKVTSVVRQRQLTNSSQIKQTASGGVTIVNLNSSATPLLPPSTSSAIGTNASSAYSAGVQGSVANGTPTSTVGLQQSGTGVSSSTNYTTSQQGQQQHVLEHGRAIVSKTPNVAIVSNGHTHTGGSSALMSTTVINTSNGTTLSSTIHPALLTNFMNAANGVPSSAPSGTSTVVNGGTTVVSPTPHHTGYTRNRPKLGDSRSTGRLHSGGGGGNKSTTRLNNAGGSMGGLHKSRLGSSQLINQFNGDIGAGVSIDPEKLTPGVTPNGGPSMVDGGSTSHNIIMHSSNNHHHNHQHHHNHHNSHHSSGNVAIKGMMASSGSGGALLGNSIPPPLSQHVTITGENKWGIPQTKITSCGVTVTTSPTRAPRPYSHGPGNTLMGSTGALGGKSSLGGLNQSTGSIGIQVHHASPASPTMFNNHSQQTSPQLTTTLSLHSSDDPSNQVIVSGPATVTTRPRGTNDNRSVTILNASSGATTTRMSVFEPYPMRDTIQHFCEKHLDKIKAYTESVAERIPPPAKCIIEERRAKKMAKLHFACQVRGPHCLYSRTMFTMRTRNPRTWIHLMFLDLQARAGKNALSSWDPSVSRLKHCWDTLKCENRTFITLVTSAFPNGKEQEALVNELRHAGFFDVFEMGPVAVGPGQGGGAGGESAGPAAGGPTGGSGAQQSGGVSSPTSGNSGSGGGGGGGGDAGTASNGGSSEDLEVLQWGCFLCHHPEKAIGFLHGNNQPVIEGQLKEKKGKWRLFRRWRTRYFTLSGAHLSCKGSVSEAGGESIDVNQIRSVKVSRGARNIPKAFEIFTGDQTLILKPKDGNKAEEWVQCLSIVLAHSQVRYACMCALILKNSFHLPRSKATSIDICILYEFFGNFF
ncbi:protein melted isoform X1 [Anopheles gambiae]|uniref:protein melted isoform X1 n=1 Tax=Anopheles gambiae TaxID=7165 RepID=UPI002AC8FFEE|nr:protein melted isoform X1 [Anopheles gambiae]XP_061507477.1 protein melted isoform X1 [Anopheles gambiae]XP_061507478.1 protein melted isoform X1 [Anopheles gambiae]XP_061507480.1 protein melted isoform X1 [Anopheles gambiae]XP_061507481.1 protein melted isoform X1 [Anopheles gambiae]XP_061507482.1 protein melted isoform X1 [Anopheles gambiae]